MLAKPGMRIALVIDDDSQPTPIGQLSPAILNEIRRGGATQGRISLVPAMGVHNTMREAAFVRRVDENIFSGLHWEARDCDSPDKLAYLGMTKHGTPVFISKVVAKPDLIISVGCIEPHIIVRFGGSYKNLMPCVAGRATIANNQSLNCLPATFNSVEQPNGSNPMRWIVSKLVCPTPGANSPAKQKCWSSQTAVVRIHSCQN